MHSSVVR